MQLQKLCAQCVKQNVDALVGSESAAGTTSSVPWNMVHAVAMLSEAVHECRFSDLHAGPNEVLPVGLSDSVCFIRAFMMAPGGSPPIPGTLPVRLSAM